MYRRIAVAPIFWAMAMVGAMQPAHAYLDPGSGSVLIQVILGGLAGLAVGAKLFWQHIVYFFSFGRRGRKGGDE